MRGPEAASNSKDESVTRAEPEAVRHCHGQGGSRLARETRLTKVARLEELARVTVVATTLSAPALEALGARFEVSLLTRTAGFLVALWIVALLTLVVTGWFDIALDLGVQAEVRRSSMFSRGGGS